MKMLRDEFDCKVPDNMEDLLKLPGVGRKSANLIMGDVFGQPAMLPTPTASACAIESDW